MCNCGRVFERFPHPQAWATFELQHDRQSAARRLLGRALELDPHHVPSWMVGTGGAGSMAGLCMWEYHRKLNAKAGQG